MNLWVGATRGLRPPNGSAATPPIRDPRRNRDRWAALLNASRGFCASALAVPELVFASFSVASAAFLGDRDQKSRRPAHLRRRSEPRGISGRSFCVERHCSNAHHAPADSGDRDIIGRCARLCPVASSSQSYSTRCNSSLTSLAHDANEGDGLFWMMFFAEWDDRYPLCAVPWQPLAQSSPNFFLAESITH